MLCVLVAGQTFGADAPSDAGYDHVTDPVKLAEMSRSILAAETFDGDALPDSVSTAGLRGKGLDLRKSREGLVFDCRKFISPSEGAVSWWIRFRSEVTAPSVRLAEIDDGGPMYIMYQGRNAWDPRHRHRLVSSDTPGASVPRSQRRTYGGST
jgi:hypothetical protein